MSQEHIQVSVNGGLMEVAFNRPERKNALTQAMYDGLTDAFRQASDDPEIRVLILRGSQDVFTSGNDLNDFVQAPPAGEDSPVFRFLKALNVFEKPLIAAVSGPAIGVGSTMLMHCDLVYAGHDARFHFPFVNLALVPEAASSYLLPRMVGHQRAAELMFFAEPFDAKRAQEMGMVNALYPPGDLFEEVRKKALELAKKPPNVLRQTKRLLKQATREHSWETMKGEGDVFLEMLTSPELAEAVSAFFEKRKADFSSFT
jgi:enoyl-CoA hydratase/carnithine racemase